MLALKMATIALAVILVCQLSRLVRSGRDAARSELGYSRKKHLRNAWQFGWLTLITAGLIELQARMSVDPRAVSHWLLYVHLALDALFVALFAAIIFRFNGDTSQYWHPKFAYSLVAVFGLVAATGIILLYQIP